MKFPRLFNSSLLFLSMRSSQLNVLSCTNTSVKTDVTRTISHHVPQAICGITRSSADAEIVWHESHWTHAVEVQISTLFHKPFSVIPNSTEKTSGYGKMWITGYYDLGQLPNAGSILSCAYFHFLLHYVIISYQIATQLCYVGLVAGKFSMSLLVVCASVIWQVCPIYHTDNSNKSSVYLCRLSFRMVGQVEDLMVGWGSQQEKAIFLRDESDSAM